MIEEWYSPREIKFSWKQMIWLIRYLPMLRQGEYPPDPRGSGYTDAPMGKRSRRHHGAYFETPCQLAAEVEARLAQCGRDGLMVKAVYCWGESEESITRIFGLTPELVAKRVKTALAYISGWRRKRRSYEEFKSHGRHRYEPLLSR